MPNIALLPSDSRRAVLVRKSDRVRSDSPESIHTLALDVIYCRSDSQFDCDYRKSICGPSNTWETGHRIANHYRSSRLHFRYSVD